MRHSSYLLLVFYFSSLIQYFSCTDIDLKEIVTFLFPSPTGVSFPPLETSTSIPGIGSNVPIVLGAIDATLEYSGFDIQYKRKKLIVAFESIEVTLKGDLPDGAVSLEMNNCSYSLSGTLTLEKAYIEIPPATDDCVYKEAVFDVISFKNGVHKENLSFCPKTNALLNVANNIPWMIAKPLIITQAEAAVIKALNDMRLIIGDTTFKICTYCETDTISFVLEVDST